MVAARQHQFEKAAMGWIVVCWLDNVHMYVWYASLLHRPMALINYAGRPATAAVVAAPILKLWLA